MLKLKIAPRYVPDKKKSKEENRVARKAHNTRMRRAVFEGKYRATAGGLTKKDLMKTKSGKIVSRKKHALGLKMFAKNSGKMKKPYAKKPKSEKKSKATKKKKSSKATKKKTSK